MSNPFMLATAGALFVFGLLAYGTAIISATEDREPVTVMCYREGCTDTFREEWAVTDDSEPANRYCTRRCRTLDKQGVVLSLKTRTVRGP